MSTEQLHGLIDQVLEQLDRALADADGNQEREPYSLPVAGADVVLTELIVAYDQLAIVRDALAG